MVSLFTPKKIVVQKLEGCASRVINARVSCQPKDYVPIINIEVLNVASNVSFSLFNEGR